GNNATCATTFTVTDATVPSVSCPALTSATADGSCQAAVPNVLSGVTASDSCSATNAITLSQSPPAGTHEGQGAHTIQVTATDKAGNSATCTTIFTVEGGVAGSGPADTTACLGQNAQFNALASGVGPFSYQWTVDGASAGGNSASLSVNTSGLSVGSHAIQVIVSAACGFVTNSAVLTVNGATAATGASPAAVCQGSDASFSSVASGTGPFSYQWSLDGAAVGSNASSLSVSTTGMS